MSKFASKTGVTIFLTLGLVVVGVALWQQVGDEVIAELSPEDQATSTIDVGEKESDTNPKTESDAPAAPEPEDDQPIGNDQPAERESNDSVTVATRCEQAGGNWLAEFSECEYITSDWCAEYDGEFSACTSACRHNSEAGACIQVCVPVCQL